MFKKTCMLVLACLAQAAAAPPGVNGRTKVIGRLG